MLLGPHPPPDLPLEGEGSYRFPSPSRGGLGWGWGSSDVYSILDRLLALQDLSDFPGKILYGKRFLDIVHVFFQDPVLNNGIVRMS